MPLNISSNLSMTGSRSSVALKKSNGQTGGPRADVVYNLFIFGAPTQEVEETLSQFANAFNQGFQVRLGSANQYTKKNLFKAITQVQSEILRKLQDGHTYFIADSHTLSYMRRANHPYSRINPHVEVLGHDLNDGQIHIQTDGRSSSISLFNDLQLFEDHDDKRYSRAGITFGSEVNRRKWFWLNHGTQRMISRPTERKIKDDHVEMFRSLCQTAFKNSLKSVR